jgi:hypothetical protein
MNEYDCEIAHPGNGINTSQTTVLRPIWQFAIDRRATAGAAKDQRRKRAWNDRYGSGRESCAQKIKFFASPFATN